jgi:hypothetical protein
VVLGEWREDVEGVTGGNCLHLITGHHRGMTPLVGDVP